jgi:hypothetical protein
MFGVCRSLLWVMIVACAASAFIPLFLLPLLFNQANSKPNGNAHKIKLATVVAEP